MKRGLILLLISGLLTAQSRFMPADTTVTTNHKTTIKGKKVEGKKDMTHWALQNIS